MKQFRPAKVGNTFSHIIKCWGTIKKKVKVENHFRKSFVGWRKGKHFVIFFLFEIC